MGAEDQPKDQEPAFSEEPVLGSPLFGELTALKKKYGLELVQRTNPGENLRKLCWLSRDEVPEGFTLPLPPKTIQFLELSSNEPGEPFQLQALLGAWQWEHTYYPRIKKIYRAVLQQHISRKANPNGQLQALRAALKTVEAEKDRHERILQSTLKEARAATSAFLCVAADMVQEKPPSLPKEGVLSRYSHLRALLHSDWRLKAGRDRDWLSESERAKKEAQRRWVFEGLLEKYSLTEMLRRESEYLWKMICDPKGKLDLQVQLKMFSDFFGINDRLVQTSGDGLLYYHGHAVKSLKTLALLSCKRGSYQVIESHIALDKAPPGWEELRDESEEKENVPSKDKKLRSRAGSVDESDSQKTKRGIYIGPAEDYWKYASDLYKNNERWGWQDVYDFMVDEQKELGLPSLRHSSFKSFASARTTYQSKHPGSFWG